jgi:AcrR family transcriptional regulator
MAYEVTKLVHGRPYRYRVRSERDPVSGKLRNRWTYLGRADAADRAEPIRTRRNARTALLDALYRLFATNDPDAVTAAAVAAEAGLANGTFYRYFRNKQDAIMALLERVRDESSAGASLTAVPADRAAARRTLREWTHVKLRSPERHGGLIRALYVLSSHDAALLALRRDRRQAFVDGLQTYLALLVARGFAQVDDPAGTAHTIVALMDGTIREAVVLQPLDDARIAATIDMIERAVFGRLD